MLHRMGYLRFQLPCYKEDFVTGNLPTERSQESTVDAWERHANTNWLPLRVQM